MKNCKSGGETITRGRGRLFATAAAAIFVALPVLPAKSEPVTEILSAADAPWLGGVNLAVGEFGPENHVFGEDYYYPSTEEMDYYLEKGMRLFRIPFLAQRVLDLETEDAPQPTEDMDRLVALIEHAREAGAHVILDMHSYGRIPPEEGLIGRDEAATELFVSAWTVIMEQVKEHPNVIVGLMNEPNRQSAGEWLEGANAAIAAIRETGAEHMILVPGSYWSGAHSWTTSDNARVMINVDDPVDNFAFEVHQYFDWDNSGQGEEAVAGVGRGRLVAFTEWARENEVRAVLGEFGWADNRAAHAEGEESLKFMSENRDVWIGWTYWAGGPWWGDYMFAVTPVDGEDRPQMGVLERYLR
jgi:endoglucanase